MAQHTPGPWRAVANLTRWNVTTATGPRTFHICAVSTDRIEEAANARLIAAAPELLDALKAMLDVQSMRKHPLGAPDEGIATAAAEAASLARAALAKAEGGAP